MLLFLFWAADTFPSVPGPTLFGQPVGPGELSVAAFFFVGVAQLLWMVPVGVAFAAQKRWETVKGLVIFAAIVFLLNAACWGLLFSGGSRMKG